MRTLLTLALLAALPVTLFTGAVLVFAAPWWCLPVLTWASGRP
jgi:hypothetical protein